MNLKVLVITAASLCTGILAQGLYICARPQTEHESANQATPQLLKVGAPAPDFSRKTADGKTVRLHDFRGKRAVVVYFYPKDETSVCTAEACSFRDAYEPLEKMHAEVIGISGDNDQSHLSFAKNHQLPFPLISDSDNRLKDLYHVPFTHGTLHGRVTYVIDKSGTIALAYFDPKHGEQHVQQAIAALRQLDSKH